MESVMKDFRLTVVAVPQICRTIHIFDVPIQDGRGYITASWFDLSWRNGKRGKCIRGDS